MRRPIRLGLLVAGGVLLLARAAFAQTTAPLPPNRMIVYDSSGSMFNKTSDNSKRYLLSQEFLRQLVEGAGTEPPRVSLGMLSLGRRYLPALKMCERDIELEVDPGTLRGTDRADRMMAAARSAIPRGQTPLYEAILRAALQAPSGEGTTLVVLTDLDDEICGPPPCDVIAELARRGRPYPTVTRIEFLVEIGVDPDQSDLVRRLRECLPAVKVVTVGTLEEAQRKGRAVAADLAQRTALPVPAPVQPVAPPVVSPIGLPTARPAPVTPNLTPSPAPIAQQYIRLTFPAETLRFNGDIGRQGLRLRAESLAGVDERDVDGETIKLNHPPGELRWSLTQGSTVIRSGSSRDTSTPVLAEVELPPARLTAIADGLPPGTPFNWTVTDVASGVAQQLSGPPEVRLPPGRYRIAVQAAAQEAHTEVTAGFGDSQTIALTPVAPLPGTLAIELRPQSPTLFAYADWLGAADLRLTGAANRSATVLRSGSVTGLPAGTYQVEGRQQGTSAQDVQVIAGQTTHLVLLLAPPHLHVGLSATAERVVWRLTRVDDGHQEVLRGPSLDQTVPPGRYRLEVFADPDRTSGPLEIDVRGDTHRTVDLHG
jgi:hypothetical protein